MFVNPKPIWSFTAGKHLRLWYGHVFLLRNYVVGQWFVLHRKSGECLWEREFYRANTIFEIVDGVILATETRSDGPWTASFGCCGISAANGEMLWRWHGSGFRGKLVRLLDKIPGYTNGFRPGFAGMCGNECATTQGDILDIHSGQLLRHEADLTILQKNRGPQTEAQKIYQGQPVEISPGLLLSTREVLVKTEKLLPGISALSFPEQKRPFGFVLRDVQSQILWDWSPAELGLNPITNYHGWRLAGEKLLILCGEEPESVPIRSEKPLLVRPNSTKYHLLVVNVRTGHVDQRIGIFKDKVSACRIEDVDEGGFVVSCDNRHLEHFTFFTRKIDAKNN